MGRATIEISPPPQSVNAGPAHRLARHKRKKALQTDLAILLLAEKVPRPMPGDRVRATAHILFPTKRRRDEDNYRAPLSKALGDALCPHDPASPWRWLSDDTPQHFTFGEVTFGQTELRDIGRDARTGKPVRRRGPAVAVVTLWWGEDLENTPAGEDGQCPG